MLSIGLAYMVLGAFGFGFLPDSLVLSTAVQMVASVGLFGLLFFPQHAASVALEW